MPSGVHSEVGRLRRVMVHRPGLEHARLTPSNAEELLFDDVLWVSKAKSEHDAFCEAMRERGVENAQHPEQRGDQIVTVSVVVPHLQDERSREIMRELARLNNQDPRVSLFDKL